MFKNDEMMKNLFLWEMESQGIKTLEDLWDNLSPQELDIIIKTITSKEFINIYEENL